MKRVLPWLPAVAWAAFLFLLSSRSSVPSPGVPHLDKVAHFGVYFVLGALLCYAAGRTGASLVTVVLIGALYGASDEFHQWFVPGRSVSLADWIADVAGVAAAAYLFARWRALHTSEPNAIRA